MDASALQLIIVPAGVIAVLFAIYLARDVLSRMSDEPGVRLTRVPRGFAPDHPAAEWLRFNSFTASRPLTDAEALSPKLVDAIMKDYAVLLPLVRWLNRALGHASAKQR